MEQRVSSDHESRGECSQTTIVHIVIVTKNINTAVIRCALIRETEEMY